MILEIIGWFGAICFSLCGIPQAWLSYKQGHSEGISNQFLSLWLAGEILTLIYIIPKQEWPIIFNLVSNILFIAIIVRYKVWPRMTTKVR